MTAGSAVSNGRNRRGERTNGSMLRLATSILVLAVTGCGGAAVRCPQATASAAAPPPAPRSPAPAPAPPTGWVVATVRGVVATPAGAALLLTDVGGSRVVPIGIGDAEAMAIDLRLRGEHFERPLTHDLFDAAVRELGGTVVMIQVNKVRDGVFVASVHLWDGHSLRRLDARTSDAVAIALGNHAPIYVAPGVFDEAALDTGVAAPPPTL